METENKEKSFKAVNTVLLLLILATLWYGISLFRKSAPSQSATTLADEKGLTPKGEVSAKTEIHYDAFDDFSYKSNPVPGWVWRYGFTNTLGGDLQLYKVQSENYGQQNKDLPLRVWQGPGNWDPNVIKNDTGKDMVSRDCNMHPKISYLHVHPGPNGEYTVVRWTCMADGTYRVKAAFRSLRTCNQITTTDVHVLRNNTPVFDDVINGHYADGDKTYEGSLELEAGDRIDFAVGYGENHNYGFDSTGLMASIDKLSL